MKNNDFRGLQINMTQMLSAISNALDCVEGELIGVSMHHAKRLACLCAYLGRKMGLSEEELFDLCACALLHDNALPEYLATEYHIEKEMDLGAHCISGERNMKHLPVCGNITDVLLYHHENADGSGPFHKRNEEIPLYARIVHLVDILDATFDLKSDQAGLNTIISFLQAQKGKMFDPVCTDLLLQTDSLDLLFAGLHDDRLSATVAESVPVYIKTLTAEEIRDFSELFAGIVDYKSAFTARHSQGVMEKTVRMADFYEVDELERMKLLLSGALHDIGKLIVSNDILEKPGRLTSEEFQQIQTHPYATYEVLSQIDGLEDVTRWASYHHEKLDGSGYPFGLPGVALDRNSRLLACIDIYQTMTEERPYKSGLAHEAAMQELNRLAGLGKLDGAIVHDVDTVFKSSQI